MALPVLIGVTGHRNYREKDEAVLRASVREVFSSLRIRCPNTEFMVLTGLAKGADTLCAEEAIGLGIPVTVVLPAAEETFLLDFEDADREKYYRLSRLARSIIIAPDTETASDVSDRTHRFRQEGIYLVEHCHVLLALWDGSSPKDYGCGTAEIVDILKRGTYRPRKGVPLRSLDNELLIQIKTPREGSDASAGKITYSGNATILDETERFNAQASVSGKTGHPLYESTGKTEGFLNDLYMTSSGLSGINSRKYRRILRLLALLSTVITIAFLLYDEVNLSWMLLFCGAGLALAAALHRWAKSSDCHRKYIEYRELAESVRVQAYLRRAGSDLDVKNMFPMSLQNSTPWIFSAVCSISVYPSEGRNNSVWQEWLHVQRDYHNAAKMKTNNVKHKNDCLIDAATAVSVALYFIVLLFELGIMNIPFLSVSSSAADTVRICMKVFLGSLSAGTMFLSNYYGKLSLPRKLSDHQRMECYFDRMDNYRILNGENGEWLEALAREELIENSNWCAYQSDNAPTINL